MNAKIPQNCHKRDPTPRCATAWPTPWPPRRCSTAGPGVPCGLPRARSACQPARPTGCSRRSGPRSDPYQRARRSPHGRGMERRRGGLKMRERIKGAVRIRIRTHVGSARRCAVASRCCAAVQRALALNALPDGDAIWYAAGDTSTDFNFYTKRAILAGVYSLDHALLAERPLRRRARRPGVSSTAASTMSCASRS